jgi:CRISPR-associated protein (TIGR03985 family)
MNYPHGEEGGKEVEADVIMRLRAWGYNVEVLYPPDLRQRLCNDIQKTGNLYQRE